VVDQDKSVSWIDMYGTVRSARLSRNRMLGVLYRDGVVFFAVMTVSSLANAIVMALAPVSAVLINSKALLKQLRQSTWTSWIPSCGSRTH
jgi:hypothetical protein